MINLNNLADSIHPPAHYSQNSLAQDNEFIGRARELATIEQCFQDPGCRLLTLIGLGGVGKTRIAWEAGVRIAHHFAQSSYFIPFAPISSPTLIVSTLAASLGYRFQGTETPLAQLIDFLRDRELLVILDNFEHLLSGVDLIAELLRAVPDLRLLITSRERLNLQQEWVLDIQGLDYPHDETGDGVEHYSAMQFFLQCARRAKADFRLTEANQTDVIRICRLVEGVPLGIELAASWVRALSCRAVGDEIERNLDFLTSSLRNIPDKHRSIRAVFAHTYTLLTTDQRLGFSKLTVFRGGFRRGAAEAVAGASLVTLAALVDKSLLRVGAGDRYDIHELLRQYAEEQLLASGEMEVVRAAHSAYYANFIHQRVEDLKGRRQLEAMAEIRADFENMRTAWNWAAIHKRADILDPMIEGLWLFNELFHHHQESWSLFRYAEQQFVTEHDPERTRTWGRLVARAPDATDAFQMQLETALQIARADNDLSEIAFCLKRLGNIAYERRDFAKATQLFEQSVTYYRNFGDRYHLAAMLADLGTQNYEGTWDYYATLQQESLRLRREIGDRVGAAWSLSSVAIGEAKAGHFAEAERMWLERMAFGYEIGNLDLVAMSKVFLSHQVCFIQGDFAKARATADEALQVATTMQLSNARGWALVTLGLLANMEEHYQEGKSLCQQAASTSALHYIAEFAAWGSSIAYSGLGNYGAARQSLSAAFKYLVGVRGLPGILACLPIAAILLAQKDNPVRAVELLALAFTHPVRAAGWMEKWPLLARLRAALELALGSEAYSAAWERGKLLDAETIVEELRQQFSAVRGASKETAGQVPLSERELEVLHLIGDGLSNRDIAARLFLSPGTVKWYLSEIYSKLGVHRRMQAVARARDLNLLS
jgi:predicted ATPase/DNA-binding CsgD family transcriptional regulator